MEKALQWIDNSWMDLLWKIVGAVLIWLFAHIAVRITGRLIARGYQSRAKGLPVDAQRRLTTSSTVMQSVSRYVIWFVAVISIISHLGFTSAVNSMLTAAGVGGIALGIGAQSFIKDVVAGIFFVLENQMSVGDYVSVADITGTVQVITLRTTLIRSFRGEMHTIPNGAITTITNYSRADYLAMVDVNIVLETDIRRAMECITEEAEAYAREKEHVVDRPEMLGITEMGGSGVTLRLVMRVQPMTQFQTERMLRQRIKARFDTEGIRIPYHKLALLEAGHD